MSHLEEALLIQVKACKLAMPEREYRFAAMATGGVGKGVRQRLKTEGLKDWRFDFAWPELMLAVEVEGGGWINGKHNRGEGFLADLKKYGAAQRMGWTIYRTAGELIKSGEAVHTIKQLINAKRDSKAA